MTAKEKLREVVEELSEVEAAEALDFLAHRDDDRDPLGEFLDGAPADDEHESDDERKAIAEGEFALQRGETISLDQVRTKLS